MIEHQPVFDAMKACKADAIADSTDWLSFLQLLFNTKTNPELVDMFLAWESQEENKL